MNGFYEGITFWMCIMDNRMKKKKKKWMIKLRYKIKINKERLLEVRKYI